MLINLKISRYTLGHNITYEGSQRHIEFLVEPGKNENLELETGEIFSSSYRKNQNIQFLLTVYEKEREDPEEEPDSDGVGDEEKYVGIVEYHEKIQSIDGVVDEPPKVLSSVWLSTKDFDELLGNLKQGYIPYSVSLSRTFSLRETMDDTSPIKHIGYLGEQSKWLNQDKENRMILIHRVGFGYNENQGSNADDE